MPTQAEFDALVDRVKKLEQDAQTAEEFAEGLKALQPPRVYTVVGLFSKYADDQPQDLLDLEEHNYAGLPHILYDWDCPDPPCGRANTRWAKGMVKNPATNKWEIPAKWQWRQMAARQFASAQEAETWLAETPEGEFLTANADIVMTVVSREYSTL